MGFTKHPEIKMAKSLVDYIFRWLGLEFLEGYRESQQALYAAKEDHDPTTDHAAAATPAANRHTPMDKPLTNLSMEWPSMVQQAAERIACTINS